MPFTTSLTTLAVVQNSNAGGKQLVCHTLILKSVRSHILNWDLFFRWGGREIFMRRGLASHFKVDGGIDCTFRQ